MTKILHIITRLDMGGSAQNTLLTCRGLSDRYEIVLVHGLSLESSMTAAEKHIVEEGVAAARKKGVRFVTVSALVRRINPIKDLWALLSLLWLLFKEKPFVVHTHSSKAGILGRLAASRKNMRIVMWTLVGGSLYIGWDAFTAPEWCFVYGRLERVGGPDFSTTSGAAAHLSAMLPLVGAVFLSTRRWHWKLVAATAGAFTSESELPKPRLQMWLPLGSKLATNMSS